MRFNSVIAARVVTALALVAGSALGGLALGGIEHAGAVDQSKGIPGICPTAVGVTVVVDFQQLGGETIVRCFPSVSAGTGLDALKGAGFQIEGVQRWGEAFVCRIENRPSAVETVPLAGNPGYKERCVDTPPASGYWSYWSAGNNCPWRYNQWGVKNRSFLPGGFEGWSFSLNATSNTTPTPRVAATRPGTAGGSCTTSTEPAPPSKDPGAATPPRTTGTTIATPPPAPTTPTGDGVPSGSGSSSNGNVASVSGPPDANAGGSAPSAKSTTSTAPVLAPSGGKPAVDGSPKTPHAASATGTGTTTDSTFTGGENAADVKTLVRHQSDASPIAKFVAAALVAALIAGAIFTARRRRAVRNA